MADNKSVPIGTLVLAGLFVLVMLATYMLIKPAPPPPELQGIIRPAFKSLGPFQLNLDDGNLISEQQLKDKWTFVFFGYISCPDICPATLHTLSQFQALLEDESGAEQADLQVMFVSVDPRRDKIKSITDYVRYFNKNFIGATAASTEIDNITRQFGAGYIIEEETAPGQYLVAHTSAIFLVDPLGRLVASFSQPHYASTILTQYKKIKTYFSGTG